MVKGLWRGVCYNRSTTAHPPWLTNVDQVSLFKYYAGQANATATPLTWHATVDRPAKTTADNTFFTMKKRTEAKTGRTITALRSYVILRIRWHVAHLCIMCFVAKYEIKSFLQHGSHLDLIYCLHIVLFSISLHITDGGIKFLIFENIKQYFTYVSLLSDYKDV